MTTPEGKVRAHLKKRLKEIGGELRKVSWIGRKNAPDELVLLPGVSFFAELKAPGEEPTAAQWREITRLRRAGLSVYVLDTPEQVDAVINRHADQERFPFYVSLLVADAGRTGPRCKT